MHAIDMINLIFKGDNKEFLFALHFVSLFKNPFGLTQIEYS